MVTWHEQHESFEKNRVWAVVRLVWLLCRHWRTIHAMARRRHLEGFQTYGDEMYLWKPTKRLVNVLQELADAIVYLTSGSVARRRLRFVQTVTSDATRHFGADCKDPTSNDSIARCKSLIDDAYVDHEQEWVDEQNRQHAAEGVR